MNLAPYPADTRAKGWRFELDYEQIEQSDTWALAGAEGRPWLLMVWLTSWREAPCGSLPADEKVIAAKLGMQAKTWAKHRAVLLRGWTAADDGRLYHPTLVARVLEMLSMRARGYRKHLSEVVQRDGYTCRYCGCDNRLTLDHVQPRSRGGSNDPSNLVLACRPCNSSKGARTPEEWRPQ